MQVLRPLGTLEYLPLALEDTAEGINIVSTSRIEGAVSGDALGQALALLQQKHPLLRARVLPQGAELAFCDGADPIPLVCERREGPDHFAAVTQSLLNRPFPRDRGPLVRAHLLHAPDGADLILDTHHAISDTQSARDLSFQCVELLSQIMQGQAPATLASWAVPLPIEHYLDQVPKRDGVAYRAGQVSPAQAIALPMESDAPLAERSTRFVRCDLDAAQSAAILAACRQHGTTLHGALAAAKLFAMQQAAAPDAEAVLSVCSFIDMRRRFVPPLGNQSIGYYVGGIGGGSLFAYTVSPQRAFWELARHVKDDLEVSFACGDMVAGALQIAPITGLVRSGGLQNATFGSVGISNAGGEQYPKQLGGLRFGEWHFAYGNPRRCGPGVISTASGFGDRIFLRFQYIHPVLSDATAQQFADRVRTILLAQAG